MATSREGVNPLRPYYIPPSIGEAVDASGTAGPSPFPHGNAGKYATKARDIFSDIDYKDYISEPSPSVVRSVKELVDQLLLDYASVLMGQPFAVAKTLLQLRSQHDSWPGAAAAGATEAETERRPKAPRSASYGRVAPDRFPESDSDADEPAYFTSNVPGTPTPQRRRSQTPRTPSPPRTPGIAPPKPALLAHQLVLRRPDSILEVISQLWQKEGAWGVWKGTNASFLYTVLGSLLGNWSRSLLSALFNVPDLGVKDDLDRLIDIASPYPWASLFVAAAAAVVTGLVLSPLDLVRTRLIATPTSRQPRRALSILRRLPSYICPASLLLPTMLHSVVRPVLTLSIPLVLRTRFMLDREVHTTAFSLAKFCTSCAALFVELPLETVLRRGQMAVLATPAYALTPEPDEKPSPNDAEQPPEAVMDTIVPPGRYDGVFGTMYSIVAEEGSRPVVARPLKGKAASKKGKPKVAEIVYRKGQGLEGLWRGWKVSWWGLVGLWGLSALNGGGGDGEF